MSHVLTASNVCAKLLIKGSFTIPNLNIFIFIIDVVTISSDEEGEIDNQENAEPCSRATIKSEEEHVSIIDDTDEHCMIKHFTDDATDVEISYYNDDKEIPIYSITNPTLRDIF